MDRLPYCWIYYRVLQGLETHTSATGYHTLSNGGRGSDDNSKLSVISMIISYFNKVTTRFTSKEQKAYATAGALAEEVLSSIKTVIAFGGEYKESDRYGEE